MNCEGWPRERTLTYEYERDTRQAYRNAHKARVYKNYQSQELNWGRVTSWRERVIVRKALDGCGLSPHAKILDIPCGTGILGCILQQFPNPVVAADISLEMMDLAREEYSFSHFLGFVQSDINQTPFRPGDFACIVTLGLMHRLPSTIREKVLTGIASLKPRHVILSYSLDSRWQRLKQRLIKKFKPSHSSAPVPAPLKDIVREVNASGFKVIRTYHNVPLLSADIILALERQA